MALQVYTGTYTGDGSDPQTVTGVGFTPKVVIIFSNLGGANTQGIVKTSDMSTGITGVTFSFGENGQQTAGIIDSLNSDGFLVRGGKNLNGVTYYFIAFAGDDVQTGSYTGDGSSSRAFTGIGFQPEWVFAQAGNNHCYHKSKATGVSTDKAQTTTTIADLTNVIKSLDTDGFTLGNYVSGANSSGNSGYWFAIKSSDDIASGVYQGNSTDDRSITGIGFQPDFVFIKVNATTQSVMTITEMQPDLSAFSRSNLAPASNRIQLLESDGFEVGTATEVNTSSPDYFYVAIKIPISLLTIDLTESVTLNETVTKELSRSLLENITLTATITNVSIFAKNLLETITLTDNVVAKITAKILKETVTLTVTILNRIGALRLTESITLDDTVTTLRQLFRTFTESISLTTTIANCLTATKSFTERIDLQDRIYGLLNGVNMLYVDQYVDEIGDYVDQYLNF